ncbi:mandelate racemase/muconate lactonizing enzyme family protein [Conexibacter woesei]|uniref:Mandelate racemase/muconate lactonizing protein n=1 Tax=Conexibacter woesei (strain DSM 14684 / CCUG 47730 / CIP 108061 / JCM 11494 / NBRC 100937 / ID131577) TaxID=469383 RepID=D3F382_CONWI|nr:enolase C-terminal domain-like protein [Conexibacter woesei]ADB50362.1 Mandelate racemase/muconate lactonizing protein [Conexibacter woesei DSM 14684]
MTDLSAAGDLRIVGIDAARVTFPLRHPVRFGPALYTEREYVLLRLRTDAGVVGDARAMTRGTPLLEALRPVAERLVGADPLSARTLVRDLRRSNVPGQAALSRAHSIADLALWDLVARAVDAPLHRLLGGAGRERVEALAVSGYLIDVRGEDAIVDELVQLKAQGFRHLKLMLGAREPAWMHRFLSRCRETVGSDVLLSLDFHFSLASLDEALAVCRPLEELELAFIEDPFPPLHWRDLRALAGQLETPLAAGEDVTDPVMFADLLEGADLLRVDPSTCGGVEDAVAGIRMAAAAGKPALPHGAVLVGTQLAAAFDAVELMEVAAPVDTGDRIDELYEGPAPQLHGAWLTVDQTPGVDVRLEWDRVEAAAVSGWSV